MGTYGELLGVTEKDTLAFFWDALGDQVKVPMEVSGMLLTEDEKLYVASVLAHFSLTSCGATRGIPTPTNVVDVFEQFTFRMGETELNPELLEFGGGQLLLLAGFFREQVRGRHNLWLLDSLGGDLFSRASAVVKKPNQVRLLFQMSIKFQPWARICRDLHRTLRENYRDPREIRLN